MSIRPLAIYHSQDLDGVCSGAIVKHFVPDVELAGFDYGQAFPWEKACTLTEAMRSAEPGAWVPVPEKRTVYMVDVSLPPADMKRLAEVSNLIWIDHHKSAIDACAGIHVAGSGNPLGVDGIRDTRFSACELCWIWLSPDQQPADISAKPPLPEAVRLLGRYDVWAKDDPEWESKIMPFQYGLRTMPGIYDPASPHWGLVLTGNRSDGTDFIPRVEAYGVMILRYQAEVNRRACETGKHELRLYDIAFFDNIGCGLYWGGVDSEVLTPHHAEAIGRTYRVLACNTTVFNSQFFDGFYDPEKHDVMCAFCRLADGRWKVSLYSTKPEINCGAICKTFGGGGHVGAAGFICDKLPWETK